jgi:Holliday junction resolvasome RuvABC endonuclease subunit
MNEIWGESSELKGRVVATPSCPEPQPVSVDSASPTRPIILAVDAGFAATGWAIVSGGQFVVGDVIVTKAEGKKKAVRKADDDIERCQEIVRVLETMCRAYKVEALVVEIPTGGAQSARAMRGMGLVTGVLAALTELLGLPVEWVSPGQVKALAGSRLATKQQVEAVVVKRWPNALAFCEALRGRREHLADALGAYMAAEHGQMLRTLVQR